MARVAMNRWQAAYDVLGHQVVNKEKRVNAKKKHYWVECSCGYESSPGNSFRFAISAGLGHIRRVGQRMRAAGELEPLPDTLANLASPPENVRPKV